MVTTIVPPTLASGGTVTYAPAPQGTAYKYDRLNRLKSSKAWQDVDAVGNLWAIGTGSSYAGMYENNFTYDANGNITAQMRKDANGTAINDLTYNRRNVGGKPVQNRLYHVNDAVSSTAFTDDIDDQDPFINNELVNSVNNYGYDEIGNLNRNNQKEIAEMVYNVTGKVKEVHRTVGSNKENLKFDYDANGNRIAKHVYTSDNVWMKSDYYVNDAQGNNMAIYTLTASSGAGLSYQLAERNIYGSSRIGTNKTPVEMIGVTLPVDVFSHTLGDRNYYLSSHTNNNLVTVTDKKLPIDLDGDFIIDEYWPHVISSADYYSYGVKMKERSFSTESTRYQFNGKEYDSETETTNQGARNSDGDLGVMETLDPAANETPNVSPYALNNNNPVSNIDPDGRRVKAVNHNSSVGLFEALYNVFNTNTEVDNPIDFFVFDEVTKSVELRNVVDKKGRFTKEFKAAISNISSEEIKGLIIDFISAVSSETVNYVDVVTNEEAKQTGTNQKHQENFFYTGDETKIPQDGSSTFVEKTGKNATLTIAATKEIVNSGRMAVPGDQSTRTSTSIGTNETESLELIKAVVAGNKAKNEKPTQKTEK
ncbi:MAG: hypothetical protein KF732_05695 [Flavobacteriales bacterium]|nr:hypothetical protein [Flavobacteriales bacterium]